MEANMADEVETEAYKQCGVTHPQPYSCSAGDSLSLQQEQLKNMSDVAFVSSHKSRIESARQADEQAFAQHKARIDVSSHTKTEVAVSLVLSRQRRQL